MLEKFYKEHRDNLVKIFAGRAGGIENAEDVVQEAFCRALEYRDSFTGNTQKEFANWFASIANNSLRDLKREHKLQGAVCENRDDLSQFEGADLSGYSEKIIREIVDDIKKLPTHMRKIVELYFLHQYHPRDIGKVVEDSNSNIRIIIHRYKLRMRERYS